MKFDNVNFYVNLSRNFKCCYNLEKISGTLHEHLRTFYRYLRHIDMKVLTSSEMVPGCRLHKEVKNYPNILQCVRFTYLHFITCSLYHSVQPALRPNLAPYPMGKVSFLQAKRGGRRINVHLITTIPPLPHTREVPLRTVTIITVRDFTLPPPSK